MKANATALLLIDVINDFDFEGAERLVRFAIPAARKIARLKERAKQNKVPVIYVNDNFGQWQSDFRQQVDRCAGSEGPAGKIVEMLRPAPDDYFVLKPKHSGFFSTPLDVLLNHLGTSKLILTGFAADICVLYTANDAYMRDFSLIVATDCVASESAAQRDAAIHHIRTLLKARAVVSSQIRFTRGT